MSIYVLVLMYASFKLSHLLTRHNPNISTFTERNIIENSEVLNFRDTNTKFAFTIEGYLDGKWKNDPRYVKLIARHKGRRNGVWYEEIFPTHRCTNDDLDQFAPPSSGSSRLLDVYRE